MSTWEKGASQQNSQGNARMRGAIYARVSTSDKDQNPETQLIPLREFVAAQGWTVVGEFVDRAPATDLRARVEWRALLDQAAKRRVDLVLVWRIDRAFRSVLDAATTLERLLRRWGVGLRSYSEPWLDTTSPFGEALYYITAAYAQLERGILAERVRAGMDRARREGKRLGRPGGTRRDGFEERWAELRPRVLAGLVGRREAARLLGVAPSTLRRLLQTASDGDGSPLPAAPQNASARQTRRAKR
jgi:DNA invertase Pin-like site-specific DNA recombinase